MTTSAALRIAFALAATSTLTGCGFFKSPDSQAVQSGEILPGSASDAMLPYDSVRSRPPMDMSAGSADEGTARKDAGAPTGGASESAADGPVAEEAAVDSAPAARPAPASGAPVRQIVE